MAFNTSTGSKSFYWAVMAGVFAACASLSAKFAMSTFINDTCFELMSLSGNSNNSTFESKLQDICYYPSLLFRCLCFPFIFICNALMWTFYTKSIQSTSTLSSTITNSSTNLFLTALMGWLLFDEQLNLTWVLGASFILVGLIVIQRNSINESTSTHSKDH